MIENVWNRPMDNNMSTAFMQRSGGSSSASSTGTGSSSGGGPGIGNAGGNRMAVIGVTRNVRLRRRGASGFGFSFRGGREHGAGFYVSEVQPGGEAQKNGLRVGDQIFRVNGYPIEDALHHEVALLAKKQQVLVLKIRSVGMIPVKDNPNDPVTWHMVQQQQQQQQQQQLQLQQQQHHQQQLQYSETNAETIPYNEIRIRIMIGEKGRLGCGVCRGAVPGLTVQGTREGGPARAAGLKAGDVIIWCNGQRLTDLPFEKAIEPMRSAAVLDLVVNRPIPVSNGLYDCPETLWMRGSSGYDSESSSLGPTSPPPLHQNPPSPQHTIGSRYQRDNNAINRNGRQCYQQAMSTSSCSSSEWSQSCDQASEWTRKPNNTTVIRVNQNYNQNINQNRGNIGYSSHTGYHGNYGISNEARNEPLYDPVPPTDYECHDFDANPLDERNRRLHDEKDNGNSHYNPSGDDRIPYNKDNGYLSNQLRHRDIEKKTITTVEVHQNSGSPAPPCPPPMSYKWQTDSKPMMVMNKQMGSTVSMGSTGSTETESSLESCGKDCASTSSSLSTSSCEPASSTVSFASTIVPPPIKSSPELVPVCAPVVPASRPCQPVSNTDLGSAIAQELQRRAQQRSLNATKTDVVKEKPLIEQKKIQNPESLKAHAAHDKLMEEFKRAHQKMFNNNQKPQCSQNENDKDQEKRTNGIVSSGSGGPPPPPLPLPLSPTQNKDDTVEMQSIESFKLKNSPSSVIPKPPSTYFLITPNTSPSTTPTNGSPRHPIPPIKPNMNGNINKEIINNQVPIMEKKSITKIDNNNIQSSVTVSSQVGKIAVKIGTYEGELKQPSRLDFLPQGKTVIDSPKPVILEEVSNGPVVSRLQNELAATLQRSNLKKKTEEENVINPPQSPTKIVTSPTQERPVSLLQSNVEKLAAALSNRVTIKINPENGSR